jgi:hypothetical protein
MDTVEPDPRTEKPNICGVTRCTGKVEWVCINEPHDTEKQRSARLSTYGYHPVSERHHFVNRYPTRSTA